MKAIAYIFCFFFLLLLACNNESAANSEDAATTSTTVDDPKAKTPEAPLVNSSPSTSSNKDPESNIKAAPIDYNALAKAYCKCAENTVSVNDKLAKLMESGDNAAFEAMLPAAEKAFKDAMDCCRNAKFQQSTAVVDQKKLFKPLKKICPNLPNQLMLKMVTEIK